jgi:preprotein translocase subunit SecG
MYSVNFLGGAYSMQIVITILHIIFSLSLVVIVLLQSGKQAGLSGSIAGGAETFFGKNKGRTIDAILSKYTIVAAIGFIITSVVLQVVLNSK